MLNASTVAARCSIFQHGIDLRKRPGSLDAPTKCAPICGLRSHYVNWEPASLPKMSLRLTSVRVQGSCADLATVFTHHKPGSGHE